jgi:hypothetical protein
MKNDLLSGTLWCFLRILIVSGGFGGLLTAVEGKPKLEPLNIIINAVIGLFLCALECLFYLSGSHLSSVHGLPTALLIQVFLLVYTEDVVIGPVTTQRLLCTEFLFKVRSP